MPKPAKKSGWDNFFEQQKNELGISQAIDQKSTLHDNYILTTRMTNLTKTEQNKKRSLQNLQRLSA